MPVVKKTVVNGIRGSKGDSFSDFDTLNLSKNTLDAMVEAVKVADSDALSKLMEGKNPFNRYQESITGIPSSGQSADAFRNFEKRINVIISRIYTWPDALLHMFPIIPVPPELRKISVSFTCTSDNGLEVTPEGAVNQGNFVHTFERKSTIVRVSGHDQISIEASQTKTGAWFFDDKIKKLEEATVNYIIASTVQFLRNGITISALVLKETYSGVERGPEEITESLMAKVNALRSDFTGVFNKQTVHSLMAIGMARSKAQAKTGHKYKTLVLPKEVKSLLKAEIAIADEKRLGHKGDVQAAKSCMSLDGMELIFIEGELYARDNTNLQTSVFCDALAYTIDSHYHRPNYDSVVYVTDFDRKRPHKISFEQALDYISLFDKDETLNPDAFQKLVQSAENAPHFTAGTDQPQLKFTIRPTMLGDIKNKFTATESRMTTDEKTAFWADIDIITGTKPPTKDFDYLISTNVSKNLLLCLDRYHLNVFFDVFLVRPRVVFQSKDAFLVDKGGNTALNVVTLPNYIMSDDVIRSTKTIGLSMYHGLVPVSLDGVIAFPNALILGPHFGGGVKLHNFAAEMTGYDEDSGAFPEGACVPFLIPTGKHSLMEHEISPLLVDTAESNLKTCEEFISFSQQVANSIPGSKYQTGFTKQIRPAYSGEVNNTFHHELFISWGGHMRQKADGTQTPWVENRGDLQKMDHPSFDFLTSQLPMYNAPPAMRVVVHDSK